MAGGVSWQDGIGTGGDDQDIVRDLLSVGTGYQISGGVDLGDFVVEVIAQCSVGNALVLEAMTCQQVLVSVLFAKLTYPFQRVEVQVLDLAMVKEAC